MKLTIPYELWRCANLCKATNDVRFYLNGVHFKGFNIEATNGHYMYQASFKEFELDDVKAKPVKGSVIVRPKNKVPASTKARNISYVEITTRKDVATIKYISLYNQIEHMDVGEVIDGKYPDSRRVVKHIEAEDVSLDAPIGFNTKYLALIDKLLGKQMFNVAEMRLTGPSNPTEVLLKKPCMMQYNEIFVLMPARI